MHFHTEWNEQTRDWQCCCGVAFGAGATPDEATLACLKDIESGFAESVGWLGTSQPCESPVIVAWVGVYYGGWKACFSDENWRDWFGGTGDTPEAATQNLMDDIARAHNLHGVDFGLNRPD